MKHEAMQHDNRNNGITSSVVTPHKQTINKPVPTKKWNNASLQSSYKSKVPSHTPVWAETSVLTKRCKIRITWHFKI